MNTAGHDHCRNGTGAFGLPSPDFKRRRKMTAPMPSSEDIKLFKNLFVMPRNAVVINKKEMLGHKTVDFFSDDLLRQHFLGIATVSSYFRRPGRLPVSLESTSRISLRFHLGGLAAVKAVVEEFAAQNIVAHITKNRRYYFIHIFYEGEFPHSHCGVTAWYPMERVRLRHPEPISYHVYPKLDRERSDHRLGGYLELPFGPTGERFINPASGVPYEDQWSFLRSITRNPLRVISNVHAVAFDAWCRVGSRARSRGGAPFSYKGLDYTELRIAHDRIYFAPWRKPGATSIDIRRARLQLERLLSDTKQELGKENLPEIRGDIDRIIEAFNLYASDEDSQKFVVLMDEALANVHRALDELLREKGLPSHDSMNFAQLYGEVAAV